jgi:hypothetical protein
MWHFIDRAMEGHYTKQAKKSKTTRFNFMDHLVLVVEQADGKLRVCELDDSYGSCGIDDGETVYVVHSDLSKEQKRVQVAILKAGLANKWSDRVGGLYD